MNKCKDCKNRKIQCHGTCEHYIEFCENKEKERIAKREYALSSNANRELYFGKRKFHI